MATTSTTATSGASGFVPRPFEPLTRETLLPYWRDRTVTLSQVAMRFGVAEYVVRRRGYEWGFPPRQYQRCAKKDGISREALEPLWNDNMVSIRAIASKFGVSESTVADLARSLGLGKKPPFAQAVKPPPFDKETLKAKWLSGEGTVTDIARAHGVCDRTVRKWVARWRLGPRPSAEPADPTEEEIYEMAAEIRKTWPESRFR